MAKWLYQPWNSCPWWTHGSIPTIILVIPVATDLSHCPKPPHYQVIHYQVNPWWRIACEQKASDTSCNSWAQDIPRLQMSGQRGCQIYNGHCCQSQRFSNSDCYLWMLKEWLIMVWAEKIVMVYPAYWCWTWDLSSNGKTMNDDQRCSRVH